MYNQYKIDLNGQDITSRCNQGFPIKQCLNESLDSATIVLTTQKNLDLKPIESYMVIEELNSRFKKDFVVQRYERQIYCRKPLCYKYIISLMNGKTIFNKRLMPSMAFTQPKSGTRYTLKDCLERIRDNYPLETELNHSRTRLFQIDDNIVSNRKAPQLFLTRPTLSEALDAVLQVENKISTIENAYKLIENLGKNEVNPDLPTVKALDFNMIGNEITTKEIVNDLMSQSEEDYANSTITYIENGLTEDNQNEAAVVYPGKGLWATFRTPSQIGEMLTDDNATMIVDRPINEIVKVKVKCISNLYTYKNNVRLPNVTYFYEFDITDFVFEREQYDALKTQSKWSYFWNPSSNLTKNNTLYYSHGDNKVYGVSDDSYSPFGLAGKITALLNLKIDNGDLSPISLPGSWVGEERNNITFYWKKDKNEALHEYEYDMEPFPSDSPSIKDDEMVYQIEYIPLTDIVGKSVKYDDSVRLESNININQSNNVVDINNAGRNTFGLVQRLGNGMYKISYRFAKLGLVPKIGDYLGSYVVTEVETANYDNYVEAVITLNKNFNMLSMYTGLDQNFRPFEVPKNGVTTYLNYEEFLIFSITQKEGTEAYNTSFINNYDFVMKTLTTSLSDLIITNSVFITRYNDDEGNQEYNYTLLPTFTTSYGNSMILAVEFNDVISSGKKLNGKVEQNVKYTNNDGIFDRFRVQFLNLSDPNSYQYSANGESGDSDFSFSNNLPTIEPTDIPASAVMIGTDNFVYQKDPSEIIKFNYYLHCVPAKDSINKIIIGKHFTSMNALVTRLSALRKMVAYQSTTAGQIYKPLNNVQCYGSIRFPDGGFTVEQTNTYIKISLIGPQPNLVSWAIGDESGNLYLGVNGNYPEIYIYFRNKRDI